jgi:hypothetical protein
MNFKEKFPDFAAVEDHIRKARAERAVAIATAITGFVLATVNGMKRLAEAAGSGLAAERDRRAIESDAFLKRSVPRY